MLSLTDQKGWSDRPDADGDHMNETEYSLTSRKCPQKWTLMATNVSSKEDTQLRITCIMLSSPNSLRGMVLVARILPARPARSVPLALGGGAPVSPYTTTGYGIDPFDPPWGPPCGAGLQGNPRVRGNPKKSHKNSQFRPKIALKSQFRRKTS